MIKLLVILDVVSFLALIVISIFSRGDTITKMKEKSLSRLFLLSSLLVFIVVLSNSILFFYGIFRLICDLFMIISALI